MFNVDHCINISKNNNNMKIATSTEKLSTTQFWWPDGEEEGEVKLTNVLNIVLEITTLINKYLTVMHRSQSINLEDHVVRPYLDLVIARASGTAPTCAEWLRNYVKSHPNYRLDSVVNRNIIYDLVNKCHTIGMDNMY
jgi:hypothetical protein